MLVSCNTNVQYWEEFWEESTRSQKNRGPMQVGFWNSMSDKYDRNQDKEKSESRTSRILNLIKKSGINFSDISVLDIGAGTGSLTIPLAKAGARVTALDFSEGMLNKLSERARMEGIVLTDILHRNWDELDVAAEGMKGKFDLVIASMTPAVRCPETFGKMLDVSKGVCYYSGWVNRRWDPSYYELYRLLFNEEYREGMHGFYLPFMELYLKGYHPRVDIVQDVWKSDETIDEVVDSVCGFFHSSRDITDQIREQIRVFYESKVQNGKYHSETKATTGMMVWDVRERSI